VSLELDAKPQGHFGQGFADESVVFGGQPLECAPAHPLRLAPFADEARGQLWGHLNDCYFRVVFVIDTLNCVFGIPFRYHLPMRALP
jgi:hypothetical protein